MDLIWSVAIGVHLSKYFWSGIIKLKMDWSPWTWIFHNETYLGVLLGLERGSPLLSSQFATQLFYGTLAYFVIVANIMVVTAQLSSPFSILRARYLLIFAMFFEVFHIVVFFSIAALFWTWIGVNTIVVICCSRLREEDFTPAMKMTAFVSVFFALFLFDTPRLGWMDTRAVVSQYFTVETADGRSARAVIDAISGTVQPDSASRVTAVPRKSWKWRSPRFVLSKALPHEMRNRCSSSVISSVLTYVSSSRPISTASDGVISPRETAATKAADACAASDAHAIGGRVNVTGRSLRGGRMRSRHIRSAVRSPSKASLMAFCVRASA